jgi:hypothetical protein
MATKRTTKAQRIAEGAARDMAALAPFGMTAALLAQAYTLERALHRWHEFECGTENGGVDYGDDNPETARYCGWYNARTGTRSRIRNQWPELMKRLARLRAALPALVFYVQGDPRGAALYALRPGDCLPGVAVDSCYSRGVCLARRG